METRPVKRDIFALRLCEAMARRGESCTSVGAAVGLTAGTISRYCNNLIAKPKAGVVRMIAEYLHAPESWLMGYDTPIDGINAKDVMMVEPRNVPMLGQVAAGAPILADQQIDAYFQADSERADFCLKVKGDSMIGARINDGDIVFIHAQPDVADGEIAVVLVDDEATLKRVYKMGDRVVLRAENPAYPPIELDRRAGKIVRILGKAIAFTSAVR